jgi:1-acyl-sn-glycerol-3-phosphate acyltransferase
VLYQLGKFLVASWFFLFTRTTVTGKDNVPHGGPIIIVANHLNNADPPLIGLTVGRKSSFMAKEELFRNPFSRFIFRSIGAFPVNRLHPGKQSLQQAERALAVGSALVLFPESHRSKDGKMHTGLPGSATIAMKNEVSIVPVGIIGTEKIKGAFWWLSRPSIRVTIGEPFKLPGKGGILNKQEVSAGTRVIMYKIAALIPPEYRGEYA